MEDKDMFEESQDDGGAGANQKIDMEGEDSFDLNLEPTQEEKRLNIYTQVDYQRDQNLDNDSDGSTDKSDSDEESNDGSTGRLGSGDNDDEEEESGEDSGKEIISNFGKDQEDKKVEEQTEQSTERVKEKDKTEEEPKEAVEWKEILEKERTKERLRLMNNKLQKEVQEAKETLWNRTKRVEDKKRTLVQQQAELYCQNQELESDGMAEESMKVTTENLETQIEEIKERVSQLEENATRLLKRKVSDEKEVVIKLKTLSKLCGVAKNIVVFYTGASLQTTQTKEVLDDLELVKNLTLIGCGEGNMKKVATEVKNMKLTGDREEVGVVIVEWDELALAEDDDEVKSEADTLSNILKLITNRGGSKFGKFMIMLPPINGQNEKALEKFSKEVGEMYKPDIKVVALMREGPMAGFKNGEARSGYVLRRCLTEVSKWLCEGEEDICEECGLLEHVGNCPIVIESALISTTD